jgi:hypothetical protein
MGLGVNLLDHMQLTTEDSPVPYQSQAARDAIGPHGKPYADYLESHALELAARFPDRKDEFLNRSLSEALAGNNGD